MLAPSGQEVEAALSARAQDTALPVAAQEVGAALRGAGGGDLNLPAY